VTRVADGVLRLPLPSEFNPLHPRALRLEIRISSERTLYISRAWIVFDEILDASPEYRVATHAWSRLLNGDAVPPDEDDAVLLQIFGEAHASVFGGRFGDKLKHQDSHRTEGSKEEPHEERPVPLRLLDALASHEFSASTKQTGEQPLTAVDHARSAMIAAFRRIGGKSLRNVEASNHEDRPPEPLPRLLGGERRSEQVPRSVCT
jgi:hypothetical protein